MPKKCIVISGGEYSPIEGVGSEDFVIACDKGCEYAARAGLVPDRIVGDFDSYAGPLPGGVPIERHQPEKDDTDTMLAIRYAVEQGFEELELLCALGGRLDHALANIQAISYAAVRGLHPWIKDGRTEMTVLTGGCLSLPRREGWALSVFSLSDECQGLCLRGTKYPLENARLTNRFPLGVSNEWAADTVEIRLERGLLLVVLAKL